MRILSGLIASYFLGSIPTAYILGKVFKGIDVRQHGSGNVGATNAFRILGKGVGSVVLALDILKGALAIIVVGNVFGFDKVSLRVLLGIGVVIGHNWTIFLRFKGGKGIATSLGVLIGLAVECEPLRIVLAVTILAWIMFFLITGFVSLSSMIAGFILPIMMFITKQSLELLALGIVFCAFVLVRHIPNIKRLGAGLERPVDFPFKRSK